MGAAALHPVGRVFDESFEKHGWGDLRLVRSSRVHNKLQTSASGLSGQLMLQFLDFVFQLGGVFVALLADGGIQVLTQLLDVLH